MKIWVDADACPVVIREILCRAAQRREVTTVFVANNPISLPRSKWVEFRHVAQGFDVADDLIEQLVDPGDLVVTSDIPLAAAVIEKGGNALSSRGELFSPETIRGILNMRDFADTLRSSGIQSSGPAPLGATERRKFADHLDRLITRYLNSRKN